MEQRVTDSVASRRLGMWPLVIFAAAALLLVAGGIYGLVAYAVAQRTREMGIRMALGASRTDVLRLVMKESLFLAVVGVSVGGVGANWLTRALASQLYGISVTDPATYAAVILLLFLVVGLASYIPARRATTVDPLVALRYD
jgi:putative ABC transport system permease protein